MKHAGHIESDFIDGGYTAHCSCGWASGERPTSRQVEALLDEHYAEQRPDHDAHLGTEGSE